MTQLLSIFFLFFFFFASVVNANTLVEDLSEWQKPTPIFSQKFDWLKLKSDEWLKGEIISMYDDELEFDSDEFDIRTFDWRDVSELRSRYDQSIRFSDGKLVQGFLVVKEGKLILISGGKEQEFPLSKLMSITSAADKRKDLWDAEISLGLDASSGNTNQIDYVMTAKIQRRTPYTRFRSDFTYNYSKLTQEETNKTLTNMSRLTSYMDWFYSDKIFFRLFDYEYYSDLQQNIKSRHSLGSSLGYHFINNKRLQWDGTIGPSYQVSSFNNSTEEDEESGVIVLGTLIEYTISSRVDFTFDYQIQFVEEESGERNSHLTTGFEFEFTHDFELDLLFSLDRVSKPIANDINTNPESNDMSFVVSLSYKF
jgi:putative salt-induced outer membrane protein YdiY